MEEPWQHYADWKKSEIKTAWQKLHPFTENVQNRANPETENRWWPGGSGVGHGSDGLIHTQCPWGKMKMFKRGLVVMGAQQYEHTWCPWIVHFKMANFPQKRKAKVAVLFVAVFAHLEQHLHRAVLGQRLSRDGLPACVHERLVSCWGWPWLPSWSVSGVNLILRDFFSPFPLPCTDFSFLNQYIKLNK